MKAGAIFVTTTLLSAAVDAQARGAKHGMKTRLRGAQFSRRATETEAPFETPTAYCDSVACPNNYVPIADASNVECLGGECKVEQCCSLFCSSFACVGAPPVPFANTILCENGVCTQEQCCDSGISRTEEPKMHDDSCLTYKCPAGFTTIDNAASKKCKHNPNEGTNPDEGWGIFSYNFGDPSPSYDFDDDQLDGAPSFDFSFDDDVDEAASYGFWYDGPDGVEVDATAAGPGDGRRKLISAAARSAVKGDFESWWSTSWSSSEEDFCDAPTCCRKLEYGLWGME